MAETRRKFPKWLVECREQEQEPVEYRKGKSPARYSSTRRLSLHAVVGAAKNGERERAKREEEEEEGRCASRWWVVVLLGDKRNTKEKMMGVLKKEDMREE